jgi:uncharacterized protein with GYD domain
MPLYMIQESYSDAANGSMIKAPQDRTAAVQAMIAGIGGTLQGLWFALGEFDVVAIIEMPDNITAAALSMAIRSTGAMSAYRTTPLLTMAEATQAMRQAGSVKYAAPLQQ